LTGSNKIRPSIRGWVTHGKHAACPLTFIAIGESTCDPALNEIFDIGRANQFGEYCGEEIEKEKSSEGSKGRNQSKSALDIHAQWIEDHCDCQCGDGRIDSLVDDTLQGLAGRDPLGTAIWRSDLGSFLWQCPDKQVSSEIAFKVSDLKNYSNPVGLRLGGCTRFLKCLALYAKSFVRCIQVKQRRVVDLH
jgi:hypothetical protein